MPCPRIHRAFTLIELLVVIAIIAILAAILFPVFAQAKLAAKKTVSLSNVKGLGTATNLYLGDNDDTFPFAFPGYLNPAGEQEWRYYDTPPVPADCTGESAAVQTRAALVYENAIFPYAKSYGIFELSGMPKKNLTVFGFPVSFVKPPAAIGLSYNGLLHNLNASQVVSPSVAVLAWPTVGNANVEGQSNANPVLACTKVGPCVFSPGGPPQAGLTDSPNQVYSGFQGNETYWVYGKTIPIVRTDGSAKSVSPGTNVGVASNSPWASPWSRVTATGGARSFWGRCTPGSSVPVATPVNAQYWCYFRPDRTE